MSENGIFGRNITRKDFLRYSAGSVASLAVAANILPGKVAMAKPESISAESITLTECLGMNPSAVAKKSVMVKDSYDYLLRFSSEIKDSQLRKLSVECLKNPVPKLMELYPSEYEKRIVKQRLVDAGYLKDDVTYNQFLPPCEGPDKNVQPFEIAPGSGWKSHHAYPGGLTTHVAGFLRCVLSYYEAYNDIYGYSLNKDLLIATSLIHDAQKPWVLQWDSDWKCIPEINIAGTGSHHILAIADAIYRGMAPDFVVTLTLAHQHAGWAADEAAVVGWIKAAGILADKDPVKLGMLAPDGKTLPLPRHQEGFIAHLGDHDYVLTAPLSSWLSAKLSEIAQKEYGMSDSDLNGKPFNAFRNYLFSQGCDMHLHQVWAEKGENALREAVKKLVTP